MIYATIHYKGNQQICCVDRAGDRVFLLKDFFDQTGKSTSELNGSFDESMTMNQFIQCYEQNWTDDIALYFGTNPDMAVPIDQVKFDAPIPNPDRNIVCMGKNYAAHAKEIRGMNGGPVDIPLLPIYFTKATHTVIGGGDDILSHEEITQKLDYEVELAIIIGKGGININHSEAEEYIFGYTVANDISARDLQKGHSQWFKGKSLTTHCPMGPWIVHKSELPFPVELDIKCYVNGELRQDSNTSELIFDIPTIISDLSRGYELHPGDIILTGTPAGVGMGFTPPKFLKPGDEVVCMIENIGAITNLIR